MWENKYMKYWDLTMNYSHHLIPYLTKKFNGLYIQFEMVDILTAKYILVDENDRRCRFWYVL